MLREVKTTAEILNAINEIRKEMTETSSGNPLKHL
jgi:hypothetical protein